jgi:zinc transport system substrate-binding protein
MRDWVARGGALLVLLALGWFGGRAFSARHTPSWTPASGRLRVLTTILPVYHFARRIGGEEVEVRNLIPAGVDPHEFALRPQDVTLVAQADLILSNGSGLDEFLTQALQSGQITDKPVVALSEGLPKLQVQGHRHHGDHDHHAERHPESGHGPGDPHLWLDPVLAKAYVERIAEALTQAAQQRPDPQRVIGGIRARAASLLHELDRLDADYRRTLTPLQNESFIAFHSAFAYLAARYRLQMAEIWQTTAGEDPSPRDVSALLQTVKRQSVRAFFAEPQFSSRALEMIAADVRVPVYILDPMETANDFDRADYLAVMRANLATLERALQPRR